MTVDAPPGNPPKRAPHRRERGAAGSLRWAAIGIGWTTAAGLTVASAGLVLDVLRVLPGGPTGAGQPPFSAIAFLARTGCLTAAILIARTSLRGQRRMRGACPRCGRPGTDRCRATAPRWARAAGYLAVAACLTRIAAEAVTWKIPATPANVTSVVVFAIGMALAGTLLPLALVHRWGRVWPRWVRPVAGRRVPRWLVLGPAFFVSGGLTSLFGPELITMMLRPPSSFGQFGVVFLWLAISSYTVWGLALGIAAASYFRRTRTPCALCGAGAHGGRRPAQRPRVAAGTSSGAAKRQTSSAASNSRVERSPHSGGTGVPGQA